MLAATAVWCAASVSAAETPSGTARVATTSFISPAFVNGPLLQPHSSTTVRPIQICMYLLALEYNLILLIFLSSIFASYFYLCRNFSVHFFSHETASFSADPTEGWRCPACQNACSVVPTLYKCYCGKMTNPQPRSRGDLTVPHSCVDLCGRNLARNPKSSCKHKCQLPCHPGMSYSLSLSLSISLSVSLSLSISLSVSLSLSLRLSLILPFCSSPVRSLPSMPDNGEQVLPLWSSELPG